MGAVTTGSPVAHAGTVGTHDTSRTSVQSLRSRRTERKLRTHRRVALLMPLSVLTQTLRARELLPLWLLRTMSQMTACPILREF